MSKKNKSQKKGRYRAVVVGYDKPVRIDSVRIQDGDVQLLSGGEELPYEHVNYEIGLVDKRAKKPGKKTIYSELSHPTLNEGEMIDGFSILVALDTNYDDKKGVAFSVGLVFLICSNKTEYELIPTIALTKEYIYTDEDTEVGSMELIALNDLIKEITAGKITEFIDGDRILFIVDHNLGNLDKYNAREIPLLQGDNDSFLPECMKLIYASTDKKNDHIFNKMLAEADKIAKQIEKADLKE